MTCIIGAKGADGSVIIADRRVLRNGYEANNESKIQLVWNKVVIAGSGNTELIDTFAQNVSDTFAQNVSQSPIPDRRNFQQIVKTIEDIAYCMYERYQARYKSLYDYNFEAIVMGLAEFDKGDPYLRLVREVGISEEIKTYTIIGHGAPYASTLFRLLYDGMLNATELGVLGYFVISTLAYLGLDQTVGIDWVGPDVVVLRTDEEPVFLNPQEFATAQESLKSLRFRYKLVRSIWRNIPQAYENIDPHLY